MNRIDKLFVLHRAKSGLFRDYQPGETPFIGNGLANNAVNGLVAIRTDKDEVFTCRGIVVSAFCEATVQIPPFIACGRAGNGLVVLEPRRPMPVRQLAYIAAYINLAVRWRFNWYRQTTVDRIQRLKVPDTVPPRIRYDVLGSLPPSSEVERPLWKTALKRFVLGDVYNIAPGDFHSLAELGHGSVPVVSCGDADNGVSGYYDVPDSKTYRRRMSIAFNGMNTLTAKYHPYKFAAKDDVAICSPKVPLRRTTEVFIQMMLNRERWRYSYYRKCFAEKLRRFEVSLPARGGKMDEDTMQAVIEASPYWGYLESYREPAPQL